MSAGDLWDLLNDPYLPFRLYADHQQGISLSSIAAHTGLPLAWISERVEAARVCIESGNRLRPPFPDSNRSPQP